jgi:acid phosphatase (class A)
MPATCVPSIKRNIIMKKISLLCLSVIAAASVHAQDPIFVTADQTRGVQIMMAPPAADSATTQQELSILHGIQLQRTKEQITHAQADEADQTIFAYKDVLGDKFDAAALPATALLAKHLKNDESVTTDPVKKTFQRVRPYNLDKTLSPVCVVKSIDDSYPSGHSTAGYTNALVLIEMVPEKRDAILARADDYAHNRMVCGVHYPSDIQAGKLLAYTLHASLDANPQFQKELAAAKVELRQALNLPIATN